MDALEKRFSNDENISAEQVKAFKEYINTEEFDSDAIMGDIDGLQSDNNGLNSNILNATKDNELCASMHDYIKQIKCMFIYI